MVGLAFGAYSGAYFSVRANSTPYMYVEELQRSLNPQLTLFIVRGSLDTCKCY